MKRYVINGVFSIDGLVQEEADIPRPGCRQVLVRVRAASLNYRDVLMVTGAYSRNIPQPLIPFSDGAGEIVGVGEGVTRWKRGDRVIPTFFQNWLAGGITREAPASALGGARDGVLAEYALFEEEGLVELPTHLSFEEGATLPCAALTAWNCLYSGNLTCGNTVLVMGSGGVSCFALQFARSAGARVIATSGSDAKAERLKALGASDVINYHDPDWEKQVTALTAGEGVDIVVEVGGAGTLARSIRATRIGGHISLIGVLAGQQGEVNPLPAVMKGILIAGIYVGSREMFQAMNRSIVLHRLHPVIDRVFPFDEARDALRHLQSGSHMGKVVISIP
ncbi:NAD(P)-dependent alcohol dehydrogenase [Geobacter sp. SVR]|uniref:zinc-dependent alcohol dehydrogenase family protein n=1 Tax=Geobacter sp. SVR TaxID=2495594 RepID=UPI00143EF504|nr:NAD(P)-dependent alcohol dehydrogenase [Geobacter sp. SVR]BCS55127.1 NADPH:quinone oxidoreductase [Geobacter sp. SVR]GCF85308.1 NADPH:quinone oxidoreductase [Geobacter sp. SVR]